MCFKGVAVVCLLLCAALGNCSLAPFIDKCKWDDTKCLKESTKKAIPIFANGIPELKVDKMDPLLLDKVDASSPNLELVLTDVVITGLSKCEPKKIERNIKNSLLHIILQCNVDLKAKYVMNGKLFVLPIEGKGDVNAKLRKLVIDINANIEEKEGKDGEKRWVVKEWKHTFELKDKSELKFENLFPDNELLRKTTNEFVENNGNEIVMEIGSPVVQSIVSKVVKNVKKFFAQVPSADLALD